MLTECGPTGVIMHQKVNVMMASTWMNDLLWMDVCVCVCVSSIIWTMQELKHMASLCHGPWKMVFFLGPTSRSSFHRPIS